MLVRKDDIVLMGAEAIETALMGEKKLPANGLAVVKSNPDKYGRVVIAWTGDRLWVNQDWLHPVEPAPVSEVETVTLRMDGDTLSKIEDVFMDSFSYAELREALKALDVRK